MNRLCSLTASILMLVALVTVPVTALAEFSNATDPDLVGLWHMDGDWVDSSGNGNHGAPGSTAAFSTDSKVGAQAGAFNGSTGYVTVPNNASLNVTNALTIEVWAKSNINWDAHTNWVYLINKRDLNSSGYGIFIDSNTPRVGFSFVNTAGVGNYVYSSNLLPKTWYHIVGTYDGSSIKVYLDGQLQNSVPASGTIATNTLNLEIGRWRDWAKEYFNGLTDEVAIYKRALSATEIQQHYRSYVVKAPTVNPVASPTTTPTITLNGTKAENTAIEVNGKILVPLDQTTTWQTTYTLSAGTNTLSIAAVDGRNFHSGSATLTVVYAADTTAPQVTATTPANSAILNAAPGAVTFTLADACSPIDFTATLKDAKVTNASGSIVAGTWSSAGSEMIGTVTFSPSSALPDGAYTATINPTDRLGNASSSSMTFTIDTTPPVLALSTLSDGAFTNNEILNIAGTVTDSTGVMGTTVNDTSVQVSGDGSFSHALLLKCGVNVITVAATDSAGNVATATRTVTLDQTAPVLAVTTPADNSKTAKKIIEVSGTVDKTSVVTVQVKEMVQSAVMNGGAFTATVYLEPGYNTIVITATDLAGNQSSLKRTVVFDDQVPSLAVITPSQDIRTNQSSMIIKGTVSDPLTAVGVAISKDNETYTPPVDGTFEQAMKFTEEKTYRIVVTATNEVGTSASVQRNVIYDITPPVPGIDPVPSPTSLHSLSVTGARESGATVTVTSATATVGEVSYPSATTWQVQLSALSEGENVITAASADAAGNAVTATATVIVVSRPPEITITATPDVIWPPNHRMVPVTIVGGVEAYGSEIKSVSISVRDEYGKIKRDNLTFGGTVMLEAWRNGNDKDGRKYTITVVVTDKGGTTTAKSATVTVPHAVPTRPKHK